MAHAMTREQAISIATRAHNAQVKHRLHKEMVEAGLVRKATLSIGAAALGALKKHGTPNDIKGFPWKLGVFTIASVAEVMMDGLASNVSGAIADTALVTYVHDAVATGSLIAGEGGELAA